MPTVNRSRTEPIPGYRLIEVLGSGGFGEVWKCEAPGGLFKALKFVSPSEDSGNSGVEQELRALQFIKSIRHPFLLSIERVEIIGDDLVIVTELADRSLHDLLEEHRAASQPGIPRADLLAFLTEAAEVLDLMNLEHGLQHLDIKPRNIFLVGKHVKVADFGLVNRLPDGDGSAAADRAQETITPLYAAPEIFLGKITPFCDQYSLAITYQELLTDTLPFTGKNFRQLALQHVQAEPNLGPLPPSDRPVVARALAKEPTQRYPSCTEFVWALKAQSGTGSASRAAPPRTAYERPPGAMAKTTPSRANQPVTPAVAPASTPVPAPAPQPASPPTENIDMLAGYRLLECVSRSPVAEVWKAQSSDGRKHLLKMVAGFDLGHYPEGNPLDRLRALRHPALAPLKIILGHTQRLALITEAPDLTLGDRLRECCQDGMPGIPRDELLASMRQVAAALDELYQAKRLQHLCLTPRVLALTDDRLLIQDFALAELLWLPAGHDPAALNTRYAAPELFRGQISRSSDQYSLALIYQELLTGVHGFRNLNQKQMALARLKSKPDLGLVPAADRAVLLRALHLDPDERFRTCTEFVEALEGTTRPPVEATHHTRVDLNTVSVCLDPRPAAADVAAWKSAIEQVFAEQAAIVRAEEEERADNGLRYLLRPGSAQGVSGAAPELPALEHDAFGRLTPATLRLKLRVFQEQWQAQRVEDGRPAADGSARFRYHLLTSGGSFWQRCMGQRPGVEVLVHLLPSPTAREGLSRVRLRIQPINCGLPQAKDILNRVGTELFHSLRACLQLPADRREEERLPFAQEVLLYPELPDGSLGEALTACGKDLSLTGMGLYLSCQPTTHRLHVELRPPNRAPVTVPARLLRVHACEEGRYEVGLQFVLDD
jgi:serine/threonine protein kinase